MSFISERSKQVATEKINKLYNHYDQKIDETLPYKCPRKISLLGKSIIDDVEFYLTDCNSAEEVEAAFVALLSQFAANSIFSRRNPHGY